VLSDNANERERRAKSRTLGFWCSNPMKPGSGLATSALSRCKHAEEFDNQVRLAYLQMIRRTIRRTTGRKDPIPSCCEDATKRKTGVTIRRRSLRKQSRPAPHRPS
jgi:hypothetical protein